MSVITTENVISYFFFFNDPATTEIYTLSLHDALPICNTGAVMAAATLLLRVHEGVARAAIGTQFPRSEEHTSELQSQSNLVCRLLLEKKKKNYTLYNVTTTHNSHTSL